MARVLGIGNVTLDIINEVDTYPLENAEVRAVAQRIARGGNCANTLTVLSLLGHRCSLATTLAGDSNGAYITQDLKRHSINLTTCHVLSSGYTPTSYICLSRLNGSRTIVHFRQLAEYRYQEFAGIPLAEYDWLHFEGRNISQTRAMLDRVRVEAPHLPVSVEIEKPREGIEQLFNGVSLLLFSQPYARSQGFTEPIIFLKHIAENAEGIDLICTWGSKGAAARTVEGKTIFQDALKPSSIVDTLGAGDTFNAGIIDARLRGLELHQALGEAVKLAGKKCGSVGFKDLSIRNDSSLP